MPTTEGSAPAIDKASTAWLDPWLHLREMTAQRNDIAIVVERYSKMMSLAIAQYHDLKARPKTAKETLETLQGMIDWLGSKHDALWVKLEEIETKLRQETERLNNAA